MLTPTCLLKGGCPFLAKGPIVHWLLCLLPKFRVLRQTHTKEVLDCLHLLDRPFEWQAKCLHVLGPIHAVPGKLHAQRDEHSLAVFRLLPACLNAGSLKRSTLCTRGVMGRWEKCWAPLQRCGFFWHEAQTGDKLQACGHASTLPDKVGQSPKRRESTQQRVCFTKPGEAKRASHFPPRPSPRAPERGGCVDIEIDHASLSRKHCSLAARLQSSA